MKVVFNPREPNYIKLSVNTKMLSTEQVHPIALQLISGCGYVYFSVLNVQALESRDLVK